MTQLSQAIVAAIILFLGIWAIPALIPDLEDDLVMQMQLAD